MKCIEWQTLSEITGTDDIGKKRVSDLGYAVIATTYPASVLQSIAQQARALWSARPHSPKNKFLQLDHLRGVQNHICEIAEMMTDQDRLKALSEIAGVELAPYPIPPAAAHINHYEPGRLPIEFHTDGTALVELIPLQMTCPSTEGTTMIYRGDPDVGIARLSNGELFRPDEVLDLPQAVGRSVLMQGRLLLHGVRALHTGTRTTLVLALRSVREPWKDGNTLARLLLDDDLAEVERPWIQDQVHISNIYRQQAGISSAASDEIGG